MQPCFNSLLIPVVLCAWMLWDFLHIQSWYLQMEFYFFFPTCIPFTYFSCLTALAKGSSTMLNSGGDPCIVLDLRGKACTFSLLKVMIPVDFFKVFFTKLNNFPLIQFAEILYHEWVLDFIKCFSCIQWWNHDFSPLSSWCYGLHQLLRNVKWVLHTWNKSHLFFVYNSFYILCYSVFP